MNYDIEMDSGAMIYIPSLIETDSGIQKLLVGNKQTHRQDWDHIRLLIFLQNAESRLKNDTFKNLYVFGCVYSLTRERASRIIVWQPIGSEAQTANNEIS
jgi:hypothetical protein